MNLLMDSTKWHNLQCTITSWIFVYDTSLNPEEGLNISLYLQNTLIFRLTVERQLAAGLNAGVSQQTNSIHYGKPKRQHARPTQCRVYGSLGGFSQSQAPKQIPPKCTIWFHPKGQSSSWLCINYESRVPREQRWYTFTCRGWRALRCFPPIATKRLSITTNLGAIGGSMAPKQWFGCNMHAYYYT